MRVLARYQRQVDTRHVNEQSRADEEDGYPETPITMRALPVRTMVVVIALWMRPLLVMRVRALTHSLPCILNVIPRP
jgi:hypothetical protein